MGQAAVDNGVNQSYCRAESIRVIQLNYLKVKNMKGTILLGSETYFVWKKDRKRQTAAQNRHDIPNFGTSLVTIIAVKYMTSLILYVPLYCCYFQVLLGLINAGSSQKKTNTAVRG